MSLFFKDLSKITSKTLCFLNPPCIPISSRWHLFLSLHAKLTVIVMLIIFRYEC